MASILSPSSTVLPNTAAVIAVFPLALGLNAILRPRATLELFTFALPAAPEAQKLTFNLIRLYGARDLYLGASTLAAWYNGDRKTLGWLLLLGGGVVFADGLIEREQTGKGVEKHWPLVPVMAALGAALLGAFDGFVR